MRWNEKIVIHQRVNGRPFILLFFKDIFHCPFGLKDFRCDTIAFIVLFLSVCFFIGLKEFRCAPFLLTEKNQKLTHCFSLCFLLHSRMLKHFKADADG